MLQRLGRTRSGKDGPARAADPAGLGGGNGAVTAGEVAAPAGSGAPDSALPARAAGRNREGSLDREGGRAAEGGRAREGAGATAPAGPAARTVALPPGFDLAVHDPLRAFLLSQAGAVDITRLELKSPALAMLKEAGIVLVVPLVSSGELIGLLNLGSRLSHRGYSGDHRRLLGALAGHAGPARRGGPPGPPQQGQGPGRGATDQEPKARRLH